MKLIGSRYKINTPVPVGGHYIVYRVHDVWFDDYFTGDFRWP